MVKRTLLSHGMLRVDFEMSDIHNNIINMNKSYLDVWIRGSKINFSTILFMDDPWLKTFILKFKCNVFTKNFPKINILKTYRYHYLRANKVIKNILTQQTSKRKTLSSKRRNPLSRATNRDFMNHIYIK